MELLGRTMGWTKTAAACLATLAATVGGGGGCTDRCVSNLECEPVKCGALEVSACLEARDPESAPWPAGRYSPGRCATEDDCDTLRDLTGGTGIGTGIGTGTETGTSTLGGETAECTPTSCSLDCNGTEIQACYNDTGCLDTCEPSCTDSSDCPWVECNGLVGRGCTTVGGVGTCNVECN